jgi:hypothetical protein
VLGVEEAMLDLRRIVFYMVQKPARPLMALFMSSWSVCCCWALLVWLFEGRDSLREVRGVWAGVGTAEVVWFFLDMEVAPLSLKKVMLENMWVLVVGRGCGWFGLLLLLCVCVFDVWR